MTKHKEVIKFIDWMKESIHHRPQCMLFCMMLQLKFPGAEPFYNNDHFITKIDGRFYDWDGVRNDSDDFMPFSDYGNVWIVEHYFSIMDKGSKMAKEELKKKLEVMMERKYDKGIDFTLDVANAIKQM